MYGWKYNKKQDNCSKCKGTDIRRILADPIKDIWVCYDCGQAQYIKKLNSKTTKDWWNSLTKEQRTEWLKNRHMHIEFASKEFGDLDETIQETLIIIHHV